jgi:putative ABC transport system permease protein
VSIAPARPDRRRRVRARSALGAGPWLVARRLRWEPGSALALFVLVGASCFLFAALPRLFNAFADDGLRHAIAHAPQQARNIREIESTRIAAGARARPLANVAERAVHAQRALPTALRELIGKHTFVVTSPRYAQSAGTASVPGLVRYLSLRAQSGVDSHV